MVGHQLPTMMPMLMPSIGIRAMKVLPRNLPMRYWCFLIGVLNAICWVLLAKSRMAVPFTKAVTISRPRKDIRPLKL